MEEEIIAPTSLSHSKIAQRDFHFKQLVEQQCGHQRVCEDDPQPLPYFSARSLQKNNLEAGNW